MALPLKQAAETTAKAAGGLRETLQDLLIPEFRASRAASEAQTQELRLRMEQVTQELRLRSDKLQEELRLRTDKLEHELRLREASLQEELRMRDAHLREELRLQREAFLAEFGKVSIEVRMLSDKMETALDVRERLSALEARMPRLQ